MMHLKPTTILAACGLLAVSVVTFAASPKVAAPPPIPADCKIAGSSAWKASVNAFPPKKPTLGVSGTVTTASAGYTVALVRNAIDLNPRIVTLDLVVTPPKGVSASVITPHAVAGSFSSGRTLDKVTVRCGKGVLIDIAPVPTIE